MIAKNISLGSMVLGIHDALVSTLGLIAGLVFALTTNYVIVLTGIIASVAAALSMTASQYLAEKANGNSECPFAQGLVTGAAYVITSTCLLMPFIFITQTFYAMGISYIIAILVIVAFNLLKTKIRSEPFWPHFLEMLIICSVVTFVAFIIGVCAKNCFNIDI